MIDFKRTETGFTLSFDRPTRPAVQQVSITWEKEAAVVLLVAFLALVLRLLLIPGRVMVEGDGAHYAGLARAGLGGDLASFLNPYWSNLWTWTIAAFARRSGDTVLAGRLAAALAGAVVVIPAYLIGRAGMGQRAGLLAAILVGVHPWLLRFSVLVYSEPVYNLIFVTALCVAVYLARHGDIRWWAALGLLAALGMLTREGAGAILLLLPLLAWLCRRRQVERGRVLQGLAVCILIFGLITGGRMLAGRLVLGSWSEAGYSTKLVANLIIGDSYYDTLEREQLTAALDSSGRTKMQAIMEDGTYMQYVFSDPVRLMRRIVTNAYYLLRSSLRVFPSVPVTAPALLQWSFLLLSIYGLWVCAKKAGDVALILCAAITLALAPLLLFFIHDRLVLAVAPLAAIGLAFALDDAASRNALLARLAALLVVIVSVASISWALTKPSDYSNDPLVQKDAGMYLHYTQAQSQRLMAFGPFIPFYFYNGDPFAKAASLPLVTSPAQLVEAARSEKVDLIAVSEWFTRLGGPGVEPLVTVGGALPPELQRLYVVGAPPTRVFIYRLRPGN
jgi:4-amino-4-deoxy-L-arabinose transferase-like glycosyltransferase